MPADSLQSVSKASSSTRWIALLGKRDEPTDGVEDYCGFLSDALSMHGIHLQCVRCSWEKDGWLRALWNLRRQSKEWRDSWVLLQYTAMAWSRRGFPVGVLAVERILRSHGARCAVVFHEYSQQHEVASLVSGFRGAFQNAVIAKLYREARHAIFTVPLEAVHWLPANSSKARFIPIGANVPERLNGRLPPQSGGRKTVVVFGITGAPHTAREVEAIAGAVRHAAQSVRGLRLVLCGRGSAEAAGLIRDHLKTAGVDIVSKGVLPAAEIANELSSADAHLFVRGPITLQRGSALAGIACGVPVVGYRNGRVMPPLDEAGVAWTAPGDSRALGENLLNVLTNDQNWADLHARNVRLQQSYLSWNRIAQEYLKALSQ